MLWTFGRDFSREHFALRTFSPIAHFENFCYNVFIKKIGSTHYEQQFSAFARAA